MDFSKMIGELGVRKLNDAYILLFSTDWSNTWKI